MKPFDLEKAKAGAPVCTRLGLKVEIFKYDLVGQFPIAASVTRENGDQGTHGFTLKGTCCNSGVSHLDLFMTTVKKTGWIGHWPGRDIIRNTTYIFPTREEVETHVKHIGWSGHMIFTEVTWEE